MRTLGSFLVGAVAVTGLIVVTACGKKDDTPQPVAPTAQAGYPPPGQPGYPPPPGQPGYPPQGGYPPPTATAPPPAPPAPTAPPAPAGAQMATPGPLAAPCQADGPSCGTHHCNTQFQKCAFPCVNAEVDCITPNACVLGLCVPKLPGT